MKILIVVASENEIKPLFSQLGTQVFSNDTLLRFHFLSNIIDVSISGIGMVASAVQTSLQLKSEKYDLAINAGICGSYNSTLKIGEVVVVQSDSFPEVGVTNDDTFIPASIMDFNTFKNFPFTNGSIYNQYDFSSLPISSLKKVIGNTVNTVNGNTTAIEKLLLQFPADIESMEGAAFMYAAAIQGVPYLQIRAVSNYVVKRDVLKWDIPLAVKNLTDVVYNLLNHI